MAHSTHNHHWRRAMPQNGNSPNFWWNVTRINKRLRAKGELMMNLIVITSHYAWRMASRIHLPWGLNVGQASWEPETSESGLRAGEWRRKIQKKKKKKGGVRSVWFFTDPGPWIWQLLLPFCHRPTFTGSARMSCGSYGYAMQHFPAYCTYMDIVRQADIRYGCMYMHNYLMETEYYWYLLPVLSTTEFLFNTN
jgi:hypothetical protein